MEALAQMKQYYEQGFMSKEDYDKKRLEIIDAVARGAKVRDAAFSFEEHLFWRVCGAPSKCVNTDDSKHYRLWPLRVHVLIIAEPACGWQGWSQARSREPRC